MVARGRFELPSAGPKFTRAIVWEEVRDGFLVWAKGRFGDRYVEDMRKSLNKHKVRIGSVEDIDRLFAGRFPGRRHLWFGVRNLLKFCGSHGWGKEYVETLMETMPQCPKSGVDKRIPKEEEVVNLLRDLKWVPVKYGAFYNLILDSSIRPFHAVEVLNSWSENKLEKLCDGFSRYHADIEREQKHTWIVMVTQQTLRLINQTVNDPVSEAGYLALIRKYRLLRPKFLQKFAYNMMRRHGIDMDAAEFLSGRKPEGVGARHYAELTSLAEEQYPRYTEYVMELRRKEGILAA